MTAEVVQFPIKKRMDQMQQARAPRPMHIPGPTPPEEIRRDSHIEAQPVIQPQVAPPGARVVIPAELFDQMMKALAFYAAQGFDHGRKAQECFEFTGDNAA